MKKYTVVEMIITYISLGWAFVFIANDNIFESSINFALIERLIHHEWIVGVAALTSALIKILGISLNSDTIRRVGLVTSALFWGIVATAMLLPEGDVTFSSGFVVYSGLSILCFWTSKEVMNGDGMG